MFDYILWAGRFYTLYISAQTVDDQRITFSPRAVLSQAVVDKKKDELNSTFLECLREPTVVFGKVGKQGNL